MLIKLFLPNGGKRELDMPIVPRVGDTLYFSDSEGLGSVGENRELLVTKVSYTGGEAKGCEDWLIAIQTDWIPDDEICKPSITLLD